MTFVTQGTDNNSSIIFSLNDYSFGASYIPQRTETTTDMLSDSSRLGPLH